jgi:hypothetical protein
MKECHDQLVERGDEREQRTHEHAGLDQRQGHLEEGGAGRRTEAERGLFQPRVDAREARRDAGDDEGHREAGVGQHHRDGRADQPVARIGIVDADRYHDAGHDQRREDQAGGHDAQAFGERAMPSAASVPRKVASTTTAQATQTLTQVGFSQSGLLK